VIVHANLRRIFLAANHGSSVLMGSLNSVEYAARTGCCIIHGLYSRLLDVVSLRKNALQCSD